jgi:hypothetical protein
MNPSYHTGYWTHYYEALRARLLASKRPDRPSPGAQTVLSHRQSMADLRRLTQMSAAGLDTAGARRAYAALLACADDVPESAWP